MYPSKSELTKVRHPLVAAGLMLAAVMPLSVMRAADDLLLRDFKPVSMLRLPETRVDQARFPVIDMHNHINDARGRVMPRPSAREVVSWMDSCNVQRVIILTGMWGEPLQGVIDTMVRPYPDRFTVFFQIDWGRAKEPDFVPLTLESMRDAVRRGARGLKVLKDFGLVHRDAEGKLLRVDDPRYDPIWEECAKLDVPVAIHTADPVAFFLPIDGANERYDELQAHPDWSFYGKDYPGFLSLLEATERVFARHPRTRFVWLHIGNWPENLAYIEKVLDRRPNVVVETGARFAELGRQPRRARQFFLKYQDRILYGSDFQMTPDMYRNTFRCLETEDEYFDYYQSPGQGRWKVYGLGLPDEVLKKIYHKNAERVLNLTPP